MIRVHDALSLLVAIADAGPGFEAAIYGKDVAAVPPARQWHRFTPSALWPKNTEWLLDTYHVMILRPGEQIDLDTVIP